MNLTLQHSRCKSENNECLCQVAARRVQNLFDTTRVFEGSRDKIIGKNGMTKLSNCNRETDYAET